MTSVSIHQPAYLPWLGYFHKIAMSDIFVFFDTTQFEKNSFINRNKIKTPQGAKWLTIPVVSKDHFDKQIKEIKIATSNWQAKHWKAIELNYKKAPFWDKYSQELKNIYKTNYQTLDEPCFDQLVFLTKALGIDTQIVKSSDLPQFQTKKEDLVIDICKELKADLYISGALGKEYITDEHFTKQNISLYFQSYQHPEYKQRWQDFVPYMAVIDLLFNHGEKSLEILMSGNINKQQLKNNYQLYV
ncbi:MAG: WbqC family protein [Candidatus Kuenenbacteria bacterium]